MRMRRFVDTMVLRDVACGGKVICARRTCSFDVVKLSYEHSA
jgi:hypothetical protein